ncbi:MAG: nucleotidyltransferase domain-containing protein [Saprospiraceae bacterium]|nr:nucleotidyltransferase domain-containing protein [Saprospiraceae bacterium]
MNFRQTIVDFLRERIPGVVGVYLFGSQANGTARPDSDYDVAFLLPAPNESPDPYNRFLLGADLGDLLNQPVDLIDLQQAKTDFRFQIISTAERIFCADKTTCDTFEMLAYSMYQRLELERRDIVEAVKKRGSVYG